MENLLTGFERSSSFDDFFGSLPSDVEPFGGVREVLILDGQVLGKNRSLWQLIGEGAEQEMIFVFIGVVAVPSGKYVAVDLDH